MQKEFQEREDMIQLLQENIEKLDTLIYFLGGDFFTIHPKKRKCWTNYISISNSTNFILYHM